MKNEIKNYCRYFIRSNLKFVIIEFILLFIALPLNIQTTINNMDIFDLVIERLSTFSLLCVVVLAMVIPIYMFRYLYKRKSVDLYFALPIQRKQLFFAHYILGLLIAIIPLTINILISLIMYFSQESPILLSNVLLFYGSIYILFFALYSIITLIAMKCNNLLDAIMITIGIIVLPFLLYLVVTNFIGNQMQNLFVSSISYTEISKSLTFSDYLSPVLLGEKFQECYLSVHKTQIISNSTSVIPQTIYCVCMGIIGFYFSRKTYCNRKEEDSEQRTVSYITYPLLIALTVVTLAIGTFEIDYVSFEMFRNVMLVFVVYMIAIFIWKRKIKLHKKEIAFFVLIYAITMSCSIAFQTTKGLDIIMTEVPNINEVKKVSLYITTLMEEEDADNYGDSYESRENTFKDADVIKKIVNMQKELVEIGSDDAKGSRYADIISFTYYMKNGDKIDRAYDIYNDKGQSLFFEACEMVAWNY